MADSATLLRQLLAESIPTGGTDADTQFTDAQITDLLLESNGIVERAAFEGWRIKAANYTELVDVTEGNASRKMSDLQAHALNMVKHFAASRTGPTEGRTRVGKINRFFR